MNILAMIPEAQAQVSSMAVNWLDFTNPIVLVLWITILMDVGLVGWLIYTTIRDMQGIRLLKRTGNMLKPMRLPASALNIDKITDPQSKEVYTVGTKPIFMESTLGVMIPVYGCIDTLGATVEMFHDPRAPDTKYLDPQTLFVGQEATAEREFNTVHLEAAKFSWILPMVAGAGAMVIVAQLLGWMA